jgi:dihydropteroate synthase
VRRSPGAPSVEERRGPAPAAPDPGALTGGLRFDFRGGSWDLARGSRLVGILNVTPDSFYDGGRYVVPERALERAERMAAEGADAIDVGGQSTRPGATPLSPEEEWSRVEPVLTALAGRAAVPLSIDTYHSEVARRALLLGVSIVNDVSGLSHDPALADHVAREGAGLVLMHALGVPDRIHEARRYADVAGEVAEFLAAQVRVAVSRGVREESIAVDPGIGFSKRADQSLETLRSIPRLTRIGRPLYIGVSRKSFLGARSGEPPEGRLAASLGATVAAWFLGGRIFRVHDVRETREALRAAESILGAAPDPPAGSLESRS